MTEISQQLIYMGNVFMSNKSQSQQKKSKKRLIQFGTILLVGLLALKRDKPKKQE